MNKILSIKHIMGFIALSMFLLVLSVPAAAKIIDDEILLPIDRCTTGQKQYQASGCSYTTETCCDRGEWCSGTCKTCSSTSESRNCSGNVTNATGGTQTRRRSVTSSCGSCSYGSWGSWTGTCTCKGGYSWNSSSQTCNKSCTLTCSSNQLLDEGSCYCCKASDYLFNRGSANANCTYNFNTCCTQRFAGGGYGGTYKLPLNMSSCTEFKSTFGLSGLAMLEEQCSLNHY